MLEGWEVAVHFWWVEKTHCRFSAVFFGCRFSKQLLFGSENIMPRNVSRETKAECRSRPQGARPRLNRVKREEWRSFLLLAAYLIGLIILCQEYLCFRINNISCVLRKRYASLATVLLSTKTFLTRFVAVTISRRTSSTRGAAALRKWRECHGEQKPCERIMPTPAYSSPGAPASSAATRASSC